MCKIVQIEIGNTDEGRCYRESVDAFNEKFDGQYYADIEFIPRNDSGGGYSDKINASVMSGDLPDVKDFPIFVDEKMSEVSLEKMDVNPLLKRSIEACK